jgi:hypothetical protein
VVAQGDLTCHRAIPIFTRAQRVLSITRLDKPAAGRAVRGIVFDLERPATLRISTPSEET